MKNLTDNSHIKTLLENIVKKDRIPNALLFVGPPRIGKFDFAIRFIKEIYQKEDRSDEHLLKLKHNRHVDVHTYVPEGKIGVHTVEAVRSIVHEVYLNPYEAKRQFFIIKDAERMQDASANALLKTMEEPPKHTTLILLSTDRSLLLKTICSRCQVIDFSPTENTVLEDYLSKEKKLSSTMIKVIVHLSEGSLDRAKELLRSLFFIEKMIEILKNLPKITFAKLFDEISELSAAIRIFLKDLEVMEEKEFLDEYPDIAKNFKEANDKRIEGNILLYEKKEVYSLFHLILLWVRDLYLIDIGADSSLITFSEHFEGLRSQIGSIKSYDEVYSIIESSKIEFERRFKLEDLFMNLLLSLNDV